MDTDTLSQIAKGQHDQHIETDLVHTLTSQAVQGTTLIEAYSYNVWVTGTLEMQKDPEAMSIEDWAIVQGKDPVIR